MPVTLMKMRLTTQTTLPKKKAPKYINYSLSDIVARSEVGEVIENIMKPPATCGQDFTICVHIGLNISNEGDSDWYNKF